MTKLYVVTATAALAAATAKTAIQLATNTTNVNVITAIDITFDGVSASAVPVLVQIGKPTAAGSGGSAFTPLVVGPTAVAAAAGTTARVNDTTPGASFVVYKQWYIPPTSGFSIQFPLGREGAMRVSEFFELLLTAPAIVNYRANVEFDE